jgi:hypothetical protein
VPRRKGRSARPRCRRPGYQHRTWLTLAECTATRPWHRVGDLGQVQLLRPAGLTVDAPSSLLAAARQATAALPQSRRHRDQPPTGQPPLLSSPPGRTEHALRKLHIHEPAVLLRAAVIDQAARDLLHEATARANSFNTIVMPIGRPAPGARQIPGAPARVDRQDAPITPQAMQPPQCPRHRSGGDSQAECARNKSSAPTPPKIGMTLSA